MIALTQTQILPSARGWPVLLGLVALFAPGYVEMWQTLWQTDAYDYVPLIAVIVAWLFWRERAQIFADHSPSTGDLVLGALLLLAGLLLQVIGRSQSIPTFEFGAQLPIFAGALLLLRGQRSLRAAWFPLVFLAFMVPLPGWWLSALTSPLKLWIGASALEILYAFGLPVAQNGVFFSIGPYQLLIADACSGLYSMFSLSAVGVLYVYLADRQSLLQRLIMLLSILPIAFVANLIRVLVLILVTYYAGADAAQSIHDLSSPILFLGAVGMLLALDVLLLRLLPAAKNHA